MDTRSKIISAEDARERLRGQPAQWVTGHFDPLLAEHVRRLRRFSTPGRLLVVEITNPARPLLPQRARAELAAALTMVDFVVIKNGELEPGQLAISQDAAITEQFVELVLRRNSREGTG